MSDGDAFLESPLKNHRINSMGLNLACEGLLLGMQAEGHRDSKTEAHPRIQIFTNLRPEMKVVVHLRSFLHDQVRHDKAHA
jgi:hypothetical protein